MKHNINKRIAMVIPNKWVGKDFFSVVTGLSQSKINQKIRAGQLEKCKDGKNTLINLQKYNNDLESGVFEL